MSDAAYKYDVAISFLSGDLDVGQKLAGLLRDRMNVFLFTDRQSEVAGADGIELLSSVFGAQARIAVVLYREGWGKTAWTGIEETAIKNRGLEQGWDFVLMIPLEANPTVPKWLPRAQIWLSYERYGLPTAVAVIERKLEELGGEAKPITAASRANEQARRVAWQGEREAKRGTQEGVDAAKAHVTALFDEIQKAVSQAPGADIQFKEARHNAARIWTKSPNREGTTVTLYWSLSWANVLNQSGLRVRLFEGYAPTAGEDIIAFENPTEVGGHEFDFEWGESGQWVWQHRDTKRYYDTAELAAFCIELLLDHSNRQ